MAALLEPTPAGLYCAAGDFHVDPNRGVPRAVITHAHTDHARPGSAAYLTSTTGALVLRERLGKKPAIQALPFGERLKLGRVTVSLHPAGHLLGSAQVRVAHRGEVWVVSGDYKTDPDPTCEPFEPVNCHTFITESTFALPVYRWPPQAAVFADIHRWWRGNQAAGRTTLLQGYSLGKAQRLLGGLDAAVGPILVHATVARFLPAYHAAQIPLPPYQEATPENLAAARGRGVVIAPPGAGGLDELGPTAAAFASGWMLLRGHRRRHGGDRGFVLSDHADWDGLLVTVRATGAERVLPTHGYTHALSRWLTEQGLDARPLGGH